MVSVCVHCVGFPEDSAVRRLYHEGPEDTVGRLEAIFTDSSSSTGESSSDARLPVAKSLVSSRLRFTFCDQY